MRRKIIDDYRLYLLNDLFGIKLIFLRSELYVATFCTSIDVYVLRYKSVLTIFSLYATDSSKINNDQKRLLIALNLYPLSFFANTPFKKIPNIIAGRWSYKRMRELHSKKISIIERCTQLGWYFTFKPIRK